MARIEFETDDLRKLTIITVTGEVSAPEVSEAIQKHNTTRITENLLWDLSRATYAGITASNVEEFVVIANRFTGMRKGGKTAIVVPTDLGFGLSRIYGSLQEVSQQSVEHMAFRDKDSALRWLAVEKNPGAS